MFTTQMGANLRAFHFLRNQELLGMKPVEKITLLQVKEQIDQIVEWKWVKPAPISAYLKYLPSAGGDMSAILSDFRGRKRLKVLWDVTGHDVAKASWSRPRTKEEYFKTLAVFWSMNAPVMLLSLPGIGSDPVNIGRITFPVKMWEEDDRVGCSYTPMSLWFSFGCPSSDRDVLFNGTTDPNESRRNELKSLANGIAYEKYIQQDPDSKKYGAASRVEPSGLTARTVIVATNAAETAVTFHKCWLCIDTCMVNQTMYDATLRAKVQQTVPCSQAASMQRGGRAGRDSPGVCVRLSTQIEWDNLPPRDPPQPHMDDQTSLYLRVASTEADSSSREQLLDTIGMTKQLRAEAQQTLFLHDLVDVYGHLTDKGNFVSNLDCETEHGCLLWIAHEYHVLPEALIIFTILSRNPTFVFNEFKKLLPHPDGDLHTMLNAWHAAAWLQHLTQGLDKEAATKVWESIIFLSVSLRCCVNTVVS